MRAKGSDLRVVIVAEHASARFGGEAVLPLHYFRLLRRRGIEAWLVVHDRTRDELAALLGSDLGRVHFVRDSRMHRLLWAVARRMPGKTGLLTAGLAMHALIQLTQRRIVRALVQDHAVTVVHEPTPVSPTLPSFIFGVDAPVVIGPMNGGMRYPDGFEHYEGPLERGMMSVGRLAASAANLLAPGKRRAAALLVANQRTHETLPIGVCRRIIEESENGVDLHVFPVAQRAAPENLAPVFAFVGRLIPLKAVDLLLEAFAAALGSEPMDLHIIGDGPERGQLEVLSMDLGLAEHVTFHGWMPQQACAELLRHCDALVLPSVRECGGAVVLEAMALGLPVIVADWGGPADYASSACGILVDPRGGPDVFRQRLADALLRLVREPDRGLAMGREGQRRVINEFDWDKKIDRIIEIYREASRL